MTTAADPLSQEDLREREAARIRAARPDLAARHDLTSYDGLAAARNDITAGSDAGSLVAVVLRNVELAPWVRDTCVFALGVGPRRAAPWRTSFTRTVFLAGDPARLRDRFPFAHIADDGSAAWTAPGPAAPASPLRRLLKLLDAPAPLPARPDTLVGIPQGARPPGRPRARRDLYIATADCTISEALVHLNHLLVEAVLDGLVAPGDHLVVRQVPRIVGLTARLAAVRVTTDPHLPGRLRAAAGLTEEALVG
ncbi:DUF6182 family protein [Streptomyces sp. NBC_00083]|uniref:DUF6182 family protein n=1 Tax=Streptomyces sp. NBC_00083 TaxID=2975647 RepID=UPI002259E0CE|nr:DUF6182 family protein [Streptomyces sp. NBC_00083]MCX5388038.1 DUF6182 family protein [Streptomyces sp. NBC_00083]